MLASADKAQSLLADVASEQRDSAENLLHYLALRRHDVRSLQLRLAARGLSSLGRAESHVLATIDAVLDALHAMGGRNRAEGKTAPLTFERGQELLAQHADTLLGSVPVGRATRIMVTMPSEAADDYTLVHDLLRQGMNCMRINCAHDDKTRWSRMIEHLRRAEREVGQTCRVLMDLGGPKLRTGPVMPGTPVIKVKPTRNALGRVVNRARVWLTAQQAPASPPANADGTLPVPPGWLADLSVGDVVDFHDARGSRRSLEIVDVTKGGCWAEIARTAYFVPGTILTRRTEGSEAPRHANVGPFSPTEGSLHLREGDVLVLRRGLEPGRPATHDSSGRLLTPATIGCTLDQVFDDANVAESIWFDDGKIGGVIEHTTPDGLTVRLTHAPPDGARLRGDKGINLPDTHLRLSALTDKDHEDLEFVVQHADCVGLSFAGCAEDVVVLQEAMQRHSDRRPAVILKIETRRGFEQMPQMLLAAMGMPTCGVMIARGDLAVECGFERLAEMQEEILWICEAAHVPVVWATQVLESLAKNGYPSRAEITDAAMGHRAECVMLNKGPHVRAAVRVLDDILRRMDSHQSKKRSMLRELRLAHRLDREVENATT